METQKKAKRLTLCYRLEGDMRSVASGEVLVQEMPVGDVQLIISYMIASVIKKFCHDLRANHEKILENFGRTVVELGSEGSIKLGLAKDGFAKDKEKMFYLGLDIYPEKNQLHSKLRCRGMFFQEIKVALLVILTDIYGKMNKGNSAGIAKMLRECGQHLIKFAQGKEEFFDLMRNDEDIYLPTDKLN